jgi:ankyrin repeat protein
LTASAKPDNSDAQLAVVTLLLAKGADVFIKNKSQETALLCAKHGRGGGIIGQRAPQAKRLTQLDRIIEVLRTWEDRVSGGTR